MQKVILWLGYVFTLGLLYLFIKKPKNAFKSPKRTKLNIEKLIKCVGTKKNIRYVNVSGMTLKITLKDSQVIEMDNLKKICRKGSFLTSDTLTILLDHESKITAEKILSQFK